MPWPFLYLPGDALSATELTAARLDGDVVDVGEGFIPADAVETAELRAASLRPLLGSGLALTHASAAWVHGALGEPPARHSVQRSSERRRNAVIDARLHYRDLRVPPDEVQLIGGIPVTTPPRTLSDLVREDITAGRPVAAAAHAMAAAFPGLAASAVAALERTGPVAHKRATIAWLCRRATQEEVTRYTS